MTLIILEDNLYTKPVIDENGRVTAVNNENLSSQIERLPNGRINFKSMPGELIQGSLDEDDLIRTNYYQNQITVIIMMVTLNHQRVLLHGARSR